MKKIIPFVFVSFLLCVLLTGGIHAESTTKLVLLGTGNPNPNPEHSGCSLAVVVNNTPYIIDFGPGLVRKAAALSPRYGGNIEAFEMKYLTRRSSPICIPTIPSDTRI